MPTFGAIDESDQLHVPATVLEPTFAIPETVILLKVCKYARFLDAFILESDGVAFPTVRVIEVVLSL